MEALTNITLSDFIYAEFILLMISLSFNAYLLTKKTSKEQNPESPILQNKDYLQFIRDQIAETKKHLKISDNKKNILDNKVVALRTAYLNIENKALDKKINSDNYFSVLNTGLNRLLKLFLPQVYGQENHVHELENRISLLSDRIQKLKSKSTNPAVIEKTVKDIKNIIPSIGDNYKSQAIVGQYMEKMENVINSYENSHENPEKPNTEKCLKNSITSMEQLHSSINLQNEEANNAEIVISQLIKQSESGTTEEDIENTLRLKEAQYEIREFKNKNLYLEKMVSKLKDRLSKLEENERHDKIKPLITFKNIEDDSNDSNEIDDLANQVKDISEREITRLRDLLKDQDGSIHTLNTELGKLRQKNHKSEKIEEFQEQTITKLKSHVRESDGCIETLEKEIEELHSKLKSTKDKKEQDADIYAKNDIDKLQNNLQDLQMELDDSLDRAKEHNRLLTYYNESIQANSAEDLAVVVFQNIEDMGCKPNMWLSTPEREIHLSDSGAMSTREKVIINNMVIGETNLGGEGKTLKFRLKNVKGQLLSATKENIKSEFRDVIDFLKFIDQLSEKMFSNQSNNKNAKKLSSYSRYLRLIANDVDQGIETQIKNSKDLLETSFAQIGELIDSGIEKKSLKKSLSAMQKNTSERLEAEDILKLKLRKQFLEIIRSMEK